MEPRWSSEKDGKYLKVKEPPSVGGGGALTQDVLQVAVLEIFHVFVLAEEILVDVPPSEQPHVRVVGDGPVRVVGPVQSRALGLGLHRRHQEGHAEEPQQLLVRGGTRLSPQLVP